MDPEAQKKFVLELSNNIAHSVLDFLEKNKEQTISWDGHELRLMSPQSQGQKLPEHHLPLTSMIKPINSIPVIDHTPEPWHWHDSCGRKDGKGEPLGVGTGITGDLPEVGSISRFSFAVSDDAGFCIAHCTNALVTMSTNRSEGNARIAAASVTLYRFAREEAEKGNIEALRVLEKLNLTSIK